MRQKNKMNLVIDCFKLVKGAGKSIGIYNLTKSLINYLSQNSIEENKVIVLGNRHNKSDFDIDNVKFVEINKNPLNKGYCVIWELFEVVKYAKKYQADRILYPRGFAPLYRLVKDTIIVHDLIPFYYHKNYPLVFNKWENAYIMSRLKSSIKHADRVITISKASLREIVEKVPQSSDKITVIYNGMNQVGYKPKETISNYIVAVTSELPHKNAIGILKSYERYYRTSKEPLDLEIVGVADAQGMDIEPHILKHIHFHKYIKEFQDMCTLIAGAKIFLFLSLAEGFGFPPLEAMQLGVPVICSNRSSLPEVIGHAGMLVNPENEEEVATAILEMEQNENIRSSYTEAGYTNIKRFSWESQGPLYQKELFQ